MFVNVLRTLLFVLAVLVFLLIISSIPMDVVRIRYVVSKETKAHGESSGNENRSGVATKNVSDKLSLVEYTNGPLRSDKSDFFNIEHNLKTFKTVKTSHHQETATLNEDIVDNKLRRKRNDSLRKSLRGIHLDRTKHRRFGGEIPVKLLQEWLRDMKAKIDSASFQPPTTVDFQPAPRPTPKQILYYFTKKHKTGPTFKKVKNPNLTPDTKNRSKRSQLLYENIRISPTTVEPPTRVFLEFSELRTIRRGTQIPNEKLKGFMKAYPDYQFNLETETPPSQFISCPTCL